MATIRTLERKKGTVYKAVVRTKGRQLSRTFRTESDAQKWAKRIEVELEREGSGLIHEGQRRRLREAIEKYRAEILPTKEPSTQNAYGGHLIYWDQKLGHKKLVDVSEMDISTCRDELARQNVADPGKPPRYRSPTTVNRYLATLGALFRATVKTWHWMRSNPVQRVEKLKQPPGRNRFLSELELERLLQACRASASPELYLAVLLSITTGARQSTIMGMRWEWVDFKHLSIHVPKTKNSDAITLPIVEEAVELLRRRRDAGGTSRLSGLVFPSRVSERQPIQLRMSWLGALKRAGIENFRWHDLRHTCASYLAMNGASLPEIGAVLGHRSAQTTQRYAHLATTHTHNLVHETMGKRLRGRSRE